MKRGIYQFDGWTLDYDFLKATRGDDCVSLAAMEMDVLLYLIKKSEMVYREDLILAVWGEVSPTDHAVVQTIHKLRTKLKTDAIKSVRKRGYYIDATFELRESR